MTARKKKAKRPSSGGRYPARLSIVRLRTMFAAYNPRRMDRHEYEELRWSIQTFGYVQLVVCNKRTRAQGWPPGSKPTIVGGHQGVRASEEEGLVDLPIHWVDVDKVLEVKLNLTLNRVHGEFIAEQVENLLRELRAGGDPLDHVGFTDDEVKAYFAGRGSRQSVELEVARRTLRERFIVPPFSILDARQGYWRQRKAAWLALGIQSELGRSGGAPSNAGRDGSGGYEPNYYIQKRRVEKRLGRKISTAEFERDHHHPNQSGGALLIPSDSGRDPGYYNQKLALEKRLGRKISTKEFQRDHYVPNEGTPGVSTTGSSVFDPVLCELVYRWFSAPGARVLDPFAGGSVRGVVAGLLGRAYVGVDLSQEQIAANEIQAEAILGREES